MRVYVKEITAVQLPSKGRRIEKMISFLNQLECKYFMYRNVIDIDKMNTARSIIY